MANLQFVIEVTTAGEPVIKRVVAGLDSLTTAAKRAGVGIQSIASSAGSGFQAMASRAGGAFESIRARVVGLGEKFGGFARLADIARGAINRMALQLGALGRALASGASMLGGFGAAAAGLTITLAGVVVGIVAVVKVIRELRDGIVRVVQQTTELEKMSRRLQIPAAALSGLSFAAKQAEVSLEEIGQGLRGLAKAFGDAQKAGSDANRVLVRDLKFTAQELHNLQSDPQKAILEIGKRFAGMADGLEKARAAQVLFGRGYQAMLQLFAEGAPELEKNIKLAKELNVAFSDEAIRAGARLGDAWSALGAAFDGVVNRLAASPRLLNALASIIERLALAIADFGKNLTDQQVREFEDAVIGVTDSLAKLANQVLPALVRILPDVLDIMTAIGREMAYQSTLSPFQRVLSFPGTGGRITQNFSDIRREREDERVRGLFTPLRGGAQSQQQTLEGLLAEAGKARPKFRPPGGGGDEDKAAQALRDLGRQLTILRDPTQALQVDIAKAVAEFEKLGASKQQIAELRQVMTDIALLEFGKKLSEQLREVRQRNEEITDSSAKVRNAIEEGLRPFTEDAPAEAVRAFRGEINELGDALRTNVRGDTLQDLAGQLDKLTGDLREVVGQRGLEEIAGQLRVLGGDGAMQVEDLRLALNRMTDPQAKITQGFDKIIAQLKAADGENLIPLVERMKDVAVATDAAKDSAAGFFDLFDAIERGSSDVFEALILGTRDVKDAFEGLKLSIVRSFTEAFAEGLKKKVGFEGAFKVNIVQFGQNLVSTIGGIFGGGGSTGNQGFFGSLFDGVFGPSGLTGGATAGGVTSTAGEGIFGDVVGGGSSTAAAAADLGPSVGTQILAIAGALFAIAQAAKSIADTSKSFRKATLGDAKATANLTAVQGINTAALIGGGAAAGAAVGTVFPGIGNVVGAALGAALGAVLAQTLNKAIAEAITGNLSKALATGAPRQREFENAIFKEPVVKVLGGFGNPAGAVFGARPGSGTSLALGAAVNPIGSLIEHFFVKSIPDIEIILDKLFSQALQKAGLNVNRQLGDFRGQGVQRSFIEPGELSRLSGDARIFARILAAMVGAGRDNGERIARFTNILVNSIARLGRSTEEGVNILYKAFRAFNDNRLLTAFQRVQTFIPEGGRRIARTVAEADETKLAPNQRDRAFDFVIRAFEKALAPLNVRLLVDTMRELQGVIRGAFNQAGVRQSRQAVRAATPELFAEGVSTQEAISNFVRRISDSLREAMAKAFSNAIAKSIGDIFAPLFNVIKNGLKKAILEGFDSVNFDKIRDKFNKAATEILAFINDPGFPAFIEKLVQLQRDLDTATRDALIRSAAARGDAKEVGRLIREELAPEIQTFEGFKALTENVRARAAQGAAGGTGFAAEQARVNALREAADRARNDLVNAAGVKIPNLASSPALTENLEHALELLQQFADSQLAYLESALQLAQQQKQLFQGIKDGFQGIIDQIDVFRGARKGGRDIVQRNLGEIRGLLEKARGGDVEAIQRIQQLSGQTFELATQNFAPGSPLLQGILEELRRVAIEFRDKGQEGVNAADKAIVDLKTQFDVFSKTVVPILENFRDQAFQGLQKKFTEIVTRLGTEGPLYDILSRIAQQLGVQLTVPEGTPGAKQPLSDPGPEPPEVPDTPYSPTEGDDDPDTDIPFRGGRSLRFGGGGAGAAPPVSMPTGAADDATELSALLRQLIATQERGQVSLEVLIRSMLEEMQDDPPTQAGAAAPIIHIEKIMGRITQADIGEIASALAAGIQQGRFPKLSAEVRRLTYGRFVG